tara:strand:- start:11141 stop:11608 length:468 start_codon:yes stop_codon:yes gene_type:complete
MKFIEKNLLYIIILSLLIFGSLVIFSAYGDKFTDVPPYTTHKGGTRKVQVEAFTLQERNKHFCKNKSFSKINENCNKLSDERCKTSDCCILLNGQIIQKGKEQPYSKCVAGSISGPIFHSEMKDGDKNIIRSHHWHHKNKCHEGKGKCPDSKKQN